MILNPLSLPVSLHVPEDVDNAPLVSVINLKTTPIFIRVNKAAGPTAVGVAAGERVLVEKDNFPGGVPVTMEAFDDAGFTSAVGAGEVLATKVAYAG